MHGTCEKCAALMDSLHLVALEENARRDEMERWMARQESEEREARRQRAMALHEAESDGRELIAQALRDG